MIKLRLGDHFPKWYPSLKYFEGRKGEKRKLYKWQFNGHCMKPHTQANRLTWGAGGTLQTDIGGHLPTCLSKEVAWLQRNSRPRTPEHQEKVSAHRGPGPWGCSAPNPPTPCHCPSAELEDMTLEGTDGSPCTSQASVGMLPSRGARQHLILCS